MNLLMLILVLAFIFGGCGFCCGGASGGMIGLLLMLGLLGRFAGGFHTE